MKKRITLIAAGCIAAGSVLLSGCATEVKATVPDVVQVQNVDADEGTIKLNTSETVKITPDRAQIVYGVVTEDTDAGKCQQANTEKINGLLEYLKSQGVEETSVSTADFSLNPRYDWSGDTQKLVGYEMRTRVVVSDVSIEQVGGMLSQGVAAGANEIESVSYYASSYDEAYEEALAKAVELAESKASVLAEASGQKVGRAVLIEEYGDRQTGRYVAANLEMAKAETAGAGMADGAVAMDVMPGEMEVTANIHIEFELVPAAE